MSLTTDLLDEPTVDVTTAENSPSVRPATSTRCPSFELTTTRNSTSGIGSISQAATDLLTSTVPNAALPASSDLEAVWLGYAELRLFAESFSDLQLVRIALSNRVGGAIRQHIRVPADSIDPALQLVEGAEAEWRKAMVRCYRRVVAPEIRTWVDASPGVGEATVARLLGLLGHPSVAFPKRWEVGAEGQDKRVLVDDEPYLRSLAQLRAYCGVAGPKGIPKGATQAEVFAAGNRRIGPILHLIGEGILKSRNGEGVFGAKPWLEIDSSGPAEHGSTTAQSTPGRNYRDVFEAARCRYEVAICSKHLETCPPAHRKEKAVRIVKQAVLRDLHAAALESLR